jgi:hypothetical protein
MLFASKPKGVFIEFTDYHRRVMRANSRMVGLPKLVHLNS